MKNKLFISCLSILILAPTFFLDVNVVSSSSTNSVFLLLPSSEAQVLILEYHAISTAPQNAKYPYLYVTKDQFDKQLRDLKNIGITGISFIDAINQIKNGVFDTSKVVLTFDDGYTDNFEASKKLQSLGFGATFFIPTNFPGKNFPNLDISYMTWDNLKQMSKMGFEIGSHTVNHIDLSLCSKSKLDYEISQSLLDIQKNLQDNQAESIPAPLTFSLPFGDFNNTVIIDIEKYGLKGCVTSNHGFMTSSNIHRAPRYKVVQQTRMSDVAAYYLRQNIKNGIEMKKGSKDPRIKSIRLMMSFLGYNISSELDIFDDQMEKEVKKFQNKFNLKETGTLNTVTIDRIISDYVDSKLAHL